MPKFTQRVSNYGWRSFSNTWRPIITGHFSIALLGVWGDFGRLPINGIGAMSQRFIESIVKRSCSHFSSFNDSHHYMPQRQHHFLVKHEEYWRNLVCVITAGFVIIIFHHLHGCHYTTYRYISITLINSINNFTRLIIIMVLLSLFRAKDQQHPTQMTLVWSGYQGSEWKVLPDRKGKAQEN